MASRPFLNEGDIDAPYTKAFAITPDDDDDLAYTTRAIYVGGAGDIVARLEDDSADVTLPGLLAGHVYRVRATRVMVATTATDLVGLH